MHYNSNFHHRRSIPRSAEVPPPSDYHGRLHLPSQAQPASNTATEVEPPPNTACPAPTLATIVGSYKSAVSKHVRRLGFVEFAWQRNYHEHIIRNEHSYEHIANYIVNNPATWEKCCCRGEACLAPYGTGKSKIVNRASTPLSDRGKSKI